MIQPFSLPSTGLFIAIVAEIIYLLSGKLHLKIPRNMSTFKFSKNYIVSCNLQKEILQVHCLHSFNFRLASFQVTQLIWQSDGINVANLLLPFSVRLQASYGHSDLASNMN